VITWERNYGGDYSEEAMSVICPNRDLAYVIVGNTYSDGPGAPDFPNPFIMKIDYRGNVLWSRTHGTAVADGVYWVRETLTEPGFVMCGYRRLAPDHEVMLLIRTDPMGNLLWERTYAGDYSGFAFSVIPTLDGGYLLSGFLGEDFPAYSEACFFKLDENGTVIWKRMFTFPFEAVGSRAIEMPNGGFLLAGYGNVGGTLQEQYFLLWTDSMGLPFRTREYGGDGPDRLISMELTPTGYLLGGYTTDDPPAHSWPHLIAVSRTGEVQWDRVLSESYTQTLRGFRVTSDGGAILTGEANVSGALMWDVNLIKIDSQGEISWTRRYGAPGGYADTGFSVIQTRDGGYLVAGRSAAGGPSGSIYAVKTDPVGGQWSAITQALVPTNRNPVPIVQPNPFRSVTTLTGHAGDPVVLYDVGGRLVGRYEGARIGVDLSPGVYFLKLHGEESDPIRIVKMP
jgi:hypothetical protein